MKFRRIASVAAASAMALSVMAVSASAADYNAGKMYYRPHLYGRTVVALPWTPGKYFR